MQFTLATCLTALAALATAYTPANTAQPPSGNPIGHPEIGELIPAGQSYTFIPQTRNKTHSNPVTLIEKVTLLLLRGPSTNVVPILTIAEAIPNTGSYVWPSVPTTLEPDTTGYGIQLIVEGTGQYQYSPQCGVKNAAYTKPSGSASGSTTVTLVSASTSGVPAKTTSSVSYVTYATASSAGTGGNFSVPVLSPTKSMSVPATLQSTFANTKTKTASSTAEAVSPTATGAAARMAVNAVAVLAAGVVGVLAF
jgi:Ser-Thr-rich glycosyl-phosphatidyl-inositol-anchored membrane family